jgi:predicted lipoprotein with Yx(FWY)xxD motif
MSPKKTLIALAAAGLLLLGTTACAPTSTTPPADSDTSASAPADDSGSGGDDAAAADAELMVADSDLGQIVVDGAGMTVYMFDSDTQGAGESTCSGQCAANWPAVTTDSDTPVVDGVTGEVGTITGVDGETQVTLNGWPLYYFAGDSAAGDTAGQGVNDVWWVLSPAGERMAG